MVFQNTNPDFSSRSSNQRYIFSDIPSPPYMYQKYYNTNIYKKYIAYFDISSLQRIYKRIDITAGRKLLRYSMIVEQKSTNSKTRANCRQNVIHFVGSLFFRRETTISLNAVLYAYISPVSVLLLLRV